MIAVHYGPGDGVDGEGLKLLADIWDAVKETELRQTCDNRLGGGGWAIKVLQTNPAVLHFI